MITYFLTNPGINARAKTKSEEGALALNINKLD
jgi:hypothetical protein